MEPPPPDDDDRDSVCELEGVKSGRDAFELDEASEDLFNSAKCIMMKRKQSSTPQMVNFLFASSLSSSGNINSLKQIESYFKLNVSKTRSAFLRTE